MNAEQKTRSNRPWLALAIVGALFLGLATFVVMRSRPTDSALISIDSNGTTRLGPVPLHNTNLRDSAFAAISRFNQGTVTVSVAESAKMSDLVKTIVALKQSGMKSLRLRMEQPPSTNRASITNR